MRSTSKASVVASPVLVGAVTVLVIIVAVFLAYNANQGLPFVPTYDVKADIPGGANLVRGNEVRAGGFRVGIIDEIRPKSTLIDGERQTIATVSMKLDKTVEPLARDTRIVVRPRSALGLKYVQITPGRSRETFAAGDTIPLANARETVEIDDVTSTFDAETRTNSQAALEGFGDAFAGRGESLNIAVQELDPFVRHLTPVMQALSDPDTELDQFFTQIGRTAAQVAPVARTQAELFANLADTFDAFSRNPAALQQTIEKSPPTLDTAIRSFQVQRPFLADFADLSARLRPAVQELPRSLPDVNAALRVGGPVLRRSVAFNNRLRRVLAQLDELAENPNTLLAIKDLNSLVTVTAPLARFVAPYQTVCNFANYFFTPLGTHQSHSVPGGTFQKLLLNAATRIQDNRVTDYPVDRPADVPANVDPQEAKDPLGEALTVLHAQPYGPAIDAQGNADCQNGQTGYLDGPLATGGRYPPAGTSSPFGGLDPDFTANKAGGSHVVVDPDTPGLAGPTWKARELGIDNLRDVP